MKEWSGGRHGRFARHRARVHVLSSLFSKLFGRTIITAGHRSSVARSTAYVKPRVNSTAVYTYVFVFKYTLSVTRALCFLAARPIIVIYRRRRRSARERKIKKTDGARERVSKKGKGVPSRYRTCARKFGNTRRRYVASSVAYFLRMMIGYDRPRKLDKNVPATVHTAYLRRRIS